MENLNTAKEYLERYSSQREKIFNFSPLDLILISLFIYSMLLPVEYLRLLNIESTEISIESESEKLSVISVTIFLLIFTLAYIASSCTEKNRRAMYLLVQNSIILPLSLSIYLVLFYTEIIGKSKKPEYIFLLFLPLVLLFLFSISLSILMPSSLPKPLDSSINLDNRKYTYFLVVFLISFILTLIYFQSVSVLMGGGYLEISIKEFQISNRSLILTLLSILSWGFLMTYSADILPKVFLLYKLRKYRLMKVSSNRDIVLEFLLDYDHNVSNFVREVENFISPTRLNLTEYYKLVNILDIISAKRCQSSITIKTEHIEVSTLIHYVRVSNNQFFRFLIKETIDKEENIDYFCTVTTKN